MTIPASSPMLRCCVMLLLLAAGAPFTGAAGQPAPSPHLGGTLAPAEAAPVLLHAATAPAYVNVFAGPVHHATAFQQQRTRRWEGAFVGAVAGALVTHLFLHQGGSTSLCDRDANQDAIRANECTAITALGGLVGAGAGYMIGGRIRVGSTR